MPSRSFDFCALQFLNQWLEKEAEYCRLFALPSEEDQRHALVQAASHFRIARNLPTKFEKENSWTRYEPVLSILSEMTSISSDNVEDVVEDAQREISKCYGGRKVLSLTTKFLWLKVKSPVRIYDSQARVALGTAEGDFRSFNKAFTECLYKCEGEIQRACSKLKSVIPYTADPAMSPSDVEAITSQLWFKERVLDIYLWNRGRAVSTSVGRA